MLIANLRKGIKSSAFKDRLGFYLPLMVMLLLAQNTLAQVNETAIKTEATSDSSQTRFTHLPRPSIARSIAVVASPLTAPHSTPQTTPTKTPSPSSSPPAVQVKRAATVQSPTAKPIPTPTPAPSIEYRPSSIEGILSFTNQERSTNNLSTLTLNPLLNQAAKARVADMFEKEYFSHTTPSGGSYIDFINATSYTWHTLEENLASGDPSYVGDEKVVSLWMESPGHRANLLSNSISEIGLAVGEGMYKGKKTWIAVQLFGTP